MYHAVCFSICVYSTSLDRVSSEYHISDCKINGYLAIVEVALGDWRGGRGGAPIDGKDKNKPNPAFGCNTYKSHSEGVKREVYTTAYKDLESRGKINALGERTAGT